MSAPCDLPRIAVLASGRGSNLQAILDAITAGRLPARVVGVFSDKPHCQALQRVPASLRWSAIPKDFPSRAAFDAELAKALQQVQPDWVVCAGYMRILSTDFVARFAGRMLNIHPSLLPLYPGLHTHARALSANDREHGASVHFVTAALDAGAVIAQARLPIAATDTPETLAQRLLQYEHPLLVGVLQLAVAGRIAEHGTTVLLDSHPLFTPLRLDCQSKCLTL